jgi:ubiquinone/menaquinone biosynthesis C-methylase UbiE
MGRKSVGKRMVETTNYYTDGQAYERLMGRWSRAAGEIFLDWLSLPKGLKWLDVGCGTGASTELIIERASPSHVSAIDPSEDQIAHARTGPAAKVASFRIGDAQSLPFGNREFDVAAMALVITLLPEPPKAVSEMKRVVRSGGTVATYMWDMLGGGFTEQPLRNALKAMNIDTLVARHANSRLDNLRGFFETAGLGSITTRTIEITVSHANFDAYWKAATALANPMTQIIRKMDASDVERLKVHLRENLSTDKTGRIAFPARANAIKGIVPE